MHDCQKFREDWIEGSEESPVDCMECRSFCTEAAAILHATEGVPVPEFAEAYWERYDDQLRVKLYLENASRTRRFYWRWSAIATAAAAIVLVATWGGMRMSDPAVVQEHHAAPEIEFDDQHIEGLNPTVVAFLGQSELFLRNFTKIDASGKEDLQEAQARAKEGLAQIETQKLRAADFAPVRIALDEYEGVLREIKNLDSNSDPSVDIADIQSLIRSSGLIASMKAYQPQVMLVSHR